MTEPKPAPSSPSIDDERARALEAELAGRLAPGEDALRPARFERGRPSDEENALRPDRRFQRRPSWIRRNAARTK
jgi:hypothetical protein